MLEVSVDEFDLILLGGILHLIHLVGTAARHERRRELAVQSREIVRQHPAPPNVLRRDPVTVPKLQDDHRAAHLLVGKQFEMGCFLARGDSHAPAFIAPECGVPLAGPPDRGDQAFRSAVEIEIRPAHVTAATTGRRQPQARLRLKRRLIRPIIVHARGAAREMVQQKFPAFSASETRVQGADLGERKRLLRPGVLEVKRPFQRREIRIFDHNSAHYQSRFRIGPAHRLLPPVLIDQPRCDLHLPFRQ